MKRTCRIVEWPLQNLCSATQKCHKHRKVRNVNCLCQCKFVSLRNDETKKICPGNLLMPVATLASHLFISSFTSCVLFSAILGHWYELSSINFLALCFLKQWERSVYRRGPSPTLHPPTTLMPTWLWTTTLGRMTCHYQMKMKTASGRSLLNISFN